MCALTNLKVGEQAKVKVIQGGWSMRQKLSLRGIVEGSSVRMVSAHYQGPVVVEVNRNSIAIGRGMAQKILVEI